MEKLKILNTRQKIWERGLLFTKNNKNKQKSL